ncbi:MAG: hypothetical protein HRU32_08660 [Rhodobacteraceae bacterium]|nr:hypothetical protein [Paracoccaceae bacterium]
MQAVLNRILAFGLLMVLAGCASPVLDGGSGTFRTSERATVVYAGGAILSTCFRDLAML